MTDLFRRRLIPDECIHLKDDQIIHSTPDELITKWNTLHPKAEFSHGISLYCIDNGWKISNFSTQKMNSAIFTAILLTPRMTRKKTNIFSLICLPT